MQKNFRKLSLLLSSLLLVSCNTNNPFPTTEGIVPEDNINSSLNYQIFVRSFADSNNDGIGDLNGIRNKIPYLKKIGVNSIWLTPIHKTSSDHGYDVQDYYSIAHDLGTFDDFDNLVKELKENNINIILDMVFNHASSATPYFQQAAKDFEKELAGEYVENSKSDWFKFSETSKSGYIKYKNYYCESRFNTSSMMDFNLENEEVIEEMGKILNFWKNKGVYGFRFDAVKYFVGEAFNDRAIAVCNKLKALAPDCFMIGEGWDEGIYEFEKYYRSDFDAFFNFGQSAQSSKKGNLFANTVNGNINNLYDTILETQNMVKNSNEAFNKNSVVANFLTNHDMDRVGSLTKDTAKLKLVASTTYLLPGTPFIYYGEEIGMKGKRIAANTDADRRMPMLFEEGVRCKELRGTVFTDETDADVATQEEDLNSILSHYMRVTSLRNKMGSMMKHATYEPYDRTLSQKNRQFYAYKLTGEGKSYTIFTNLSNSEDKIFEIPTTFSKVLGYVNAKDYTVNYELNGNTLLLPSYSTIILED